MTTKKPITTFTTPGSRKKYNGPFISYKKLTNPNDQKLRIQRRVRFGGIFLGLHADMHDVCRYLSKCAKR
jgi:hypothetical protein